MSLRALLGACLGLLMIVPAPGAAALGVDLPLDVRLVQRDVARLVHDVAAPLSPNAPPTEAAPPRATPVARADAQRDPPMPLGPTQASGAPLPWLVTLAAAAAGIVVLAVGPALTRLRGRAFASLVRAVLGVEILVTAAILAWYEWHAGLETIVTNGGFLLVSLAAWIALLLAWGVARGAGRAPLSSAPLHGERAHAGGA